jgi:hypothetical protein
MKMNKWTLGLAAVGLVSLAPGLRAADAGPTPVPVTGLTATTISGYVDTSAVWNPGTGNANPAPYAFNSGKQDGFNLDSVDIRLEKPLAEGQWSAGYVAELMYGPDASVALGSWAPVRQAYVDLRVPVGNGLDFKVGEWDQLLGYESTDSYKNPNWTRSYGYTIEPTEHIGVLATYKFGDCVTAQVGVVNDLSTGYNRNYSGGDETTIESKKGVVSLLSLTAPDSWGWLKGSGFYAGVDYGPGNAYNLEESHVVDKTHLYVGATVNTPITGLSLGASWDTVNNSDLSVTTDSDSDREGYASALAAYLSYKATDKLTLNTRFEYAHGSAFDALFAGNPQSDYGESQYELKNGVPQESKVIALTETVQYQLWDNVISRLEVRWDHSADGSPHFGGNSSYYYDEGYYGNPTKKNELLVAANIIYKF